MTDCSAEILVEISSAVAFYAVCHASVFCSAVEVHNLCFRNACILLGSSVVQQIIDYFQRLSY